MSEEGKRQHLFISHHHKDDSEVSNLTKMLNDRGWDVRNSSIRVKASNQERIDKEQIPERTLKRLLRMKINWASTVVVLIGSETHSRPWVNWEIEQAHKRGKNIVGVYMRGATESDMPELLKTKYASNIVGWNSQSIMDAIEGRSIGVFETPDGKPREPVQTSPRTSCP
jgi:MTH538 TIR-like domain (DUF1863)